MASSSSVPWPPSTPTAKCSTRTALCLPGPDLVRGQMRLTPPAPSIRPWSWWRPTRSCPRSGPTSWRGPVRTRFRRPSVRRIQCGTGIRCSRWPRATWRPISGPSRSWPCRWWRRPSAAGSSSRPVFRTSPRRERGATMTLTLDELGAEASTCTRCRLAKGRTQVVFGVGNPKAGLMFIGEGPGYHEDKQGEPFVGAAGQLLTRLLGEIGLRREDVYICNVVKCRPPGNRDPLPDEIEACRPFLLGQLESIGPRVIVTLGNFATRVILDKQVSISRVRGQRFTVDGRTVIPTFHPAAVLHGGGESGNQMQALRSDFRSIREVLDEPVPELVM